MSWMFLCSSRTTAEIHHLNGSPLLVSHRSSGRRMASRPVPAWLLRARTGSCRWPWRFGRHPVGFLLFQNSGHGHEVVPGVRAQRWPCFDGGEDQQCSTKSEEGSPSRSLIDVCHAPAMRRLSWDEFDQAVLVLSRAFSGTSFHRCAWDPTGWTVSWLPSAMRWNSRCSHSGFDLSGGG